MGYIRLRDYPPIMENQMEKKMENEMETAGNIGILRYILGLYRGNGKENGNYYNGLYRDNARVLRYNSSSTPSSSFSSWS